MYRVYQNAAIDLRFVVLKQRQAYSYAKEFKFVYLLYVGFLFTTITSVIVVFFSFSLFSFDCGIVIVVFDHILLQWLALDERTLKISSESRLRSFMVGTTTPDLQIHLIYMRIFSIASENRIN